MHLRYAFLLVSCHHVPISRSEIWWPASASLSIALPVQVTVHLVTCLPRPHHTLTLGLPCATFTQVLNAGPSDWLPLQLFSVILSSATKRFL